MRLDDLHKVFNDAYCVYMREATNGWGADKAEKFALRAVVTALRDELRREWFLDDSGLDAVERWLNEILAPREGGNGAAGVTALEAVGAGLSPASGQAPAAPAPVCVWVKCLDLDNNAVVGLPSCGPWSYSGVDREVCPNCLKPISFKAEAQR